MKRNKSKIAALLLTTVMIMSLVGCGNDDTQASTEESSQVSETETSSEVESSVEVAASTEVSTETEASTEVSTETSAENTTETVIEAGEGPLALNYEIEPEAYVGEWVLVSAYTAADDMLEVIPEACFLNIETAIDTNKLVDEAAYIHADATNLSGTMSFNAEGIAVDDYSCSGAWTDWSIVDVQGEGEAYFKGALKFKIRDDDEGMFFDVLTGVEIEDMELFNVLGINAEGQLILGYSEDNIVKKGSAEWEYAYIFEQK